MKKLRRGEFLTTPKFSDEDLKNKTDQELCDAIIKLDCTLKGLSSLPELKNCMILCCSGNYLSSLPALERCTKLNCSNNGLTSLPTLKGCTELKCTNNQLTSLPALEICTELWCFKNQLTSLPTLDQCIELCCYNNQLTSLPALERCTYLRCSRNQLFSEDLKDWRFIWRLKKKIANKKIHRYIREQTILKERRNLESFLCLLPLDVVKMSLKFI
jgi:hypothetical protein